MTPHQHIRVLINANENNLTISKIIKQRHGVEVKITRIDEIRSYLRSEEELQKAQMEKIYGNNSLRLRN